MGISGRERIDMEITPDEWGEPYPCHHVTLFTAMYPLYLTEGSWIRIRLQYHASEIFQQACSQNEGEEGE